MVGYYDPEIGHEERCDACRLPYGTVFTIRDNESQLMLCHQCLCNAHHFPGYSHWTLDMYKQRERMMGGEDFECYGSL